MMTSNHQLNMETVNTLREMDQGSGFFTELIDEYAIQSQGLLSKIGAGIEACDWEQIRFSVHTLKGSSYNLGADEAAAVCEQIEAANLQQNAKDLQELFPILQDTCSAATAALRSVA